MVTSAEFDEVLVPNDWQNNVLMRTFDSLVGFNKKKKKKGKSMKSIKEEWENGRWVKKTSEQRKAEAFHKAVQDKINSGDMKVVSLDKKKKATVDKEGKIVTSDKPKKEDKVYTGHLINKVGKTESQIKKELSSRNSSKIKKTFEEPGDTHYTIKEIAEIVFPRSAKVREAFPSPEAFKDALIRDEKLRQKWDEKVINYKGHKEEKKGHKTTKAEKAKNAELETDLNKIANWFWNHKDDKSFKVVLGGDVKTYTQTVRRIKNDERGLKYYAKLMQAAGYKKEEEKPFNAKPTIIKKGQAAVKWDYDSAVYTLTPAIRRVQEEYKNADKDCAIGMNWAMEELFGMDWKEI